MLVGFTHWTLTGLFLPGQNGFGYYQVVVEPKEMQTTRRVG